MDSQTAIKVEGLSKKYVKGSKKYLQQSFFQSLADGSLFKPETREEFYALEDLTFEVKKGEVIGVIGRNGAGKSTLLRILSGVTTPDEGEVLVNGKVASILEIGTGFHPDLTGRENVYLSGQLMGMTKEEIDEKYDAILEFSELANFIGEPVKHYSNGMYLRLAFSIFTHVNADIILLDEVLSVGDQSFVEKCRQRILDLLQTDITFVIVSHNMLSIVDYSDRIMLLNKGALTAFEDATKVVEDYLEENRKEKYGVEKKEGGENGQENDEGGDDYSSNKLPIDLEEVIIHEISARNPKRDNKDLYMDEPIRVSFTFTKTSSDTYTGLVFPIRSAFGVFFHCDSPHFNPDKQIEFNGAGKYYLEFEYPPYFLNYGTYYLTVIVGRDHEFLARVEDLYSFKVKNSPYEEEMVYDFPKFPSRHLLEWKCTKLEEVQQ